MTTPIPSRPPRRDEPSARPAPRTEAAAAFARYALLSRLLDEAFRVPGTRWRFGLDALIGLVPGAGDVVGSLAGLYGLWVARSLGVPASVQLRMLANLALDALAGTVPVLGDAFDFAFKAHVRNRRLLERWVESPGPTRRGSLAILVVAAMGLVVVTAAAIAVAVVVVTATAHWLQARA